MYSKETSVLFPSKICRITIVPKPTTEVVDLRQKNKALEQPTATFGHSVSAE